MGYGLHDLVKGGVATSLRMPMTYLETQRCVPFWLVSFDGLREGTTVVSNEQVTRTHVLAHWYGVFSLSDRRKLIYCPWTTHHLEPKA